MPNQVAKPYAVYFYMFDQRGFGGTGRAKILAYSAEDAKFQFQVEAGGGTVRYDVYKIGPRPEENPKD